MHAFAGGHFALARSILLSYANGRPTMNKPKGKREPRPPKGLSAAFAEAEAEIREAEIINIIVELIDAARERITTGESRLYLEQFFYEALRGRKTLPAATVIAWADAGNPVADRAVRRYGAEVLDQGREAELTALVRAQLVKLLLRPPVPYPQGRHVLANLLRDFWLPMLMQNVAAALHVPATRAADRAGSAIAPSAGSLIAKALARRGVKLSERQINRIYWERERLWADLESSMPPIPVNTEIFVGR
jgi:hypothetical protein